jgi:hypothetical protein
MSVANTYPKLWYGWGGLTVAAIVPVLVSLKLMLSGLFGHHCRGARDEPPSGPRLVPPAESRVHHASTLLAQVDHQRTSAQYGTRQHLRRFHGGSRSLARESQPGPFEIMVLEVLERQNASMTRAEPMPPPAHSAATPMPPPRR